jgi:dihydroorotase
MFSGSYSIDCQTKSFKGGELTFDGDFYLTKKEEEEDASLFIAPGFIDIHTHIYNGVNLSISPARCGFMHGVHLLIDAGSAGASNYLPLRDYMVPRFKTRIKAFLNISSIGLTSDKPYHDMRCVDPELAANCIKEDEGKFLVGIKVLSCRGRSENRGIKPLELAVQAAELAKRPIMAHVGSGPPDFSFTCLTK